MQETDEQSEGKDKDRGRGRQRERGRQSTGVKERKCLLMDHLLDVDSLTSGQRRFEFHREAGSGGCGFV